MNKLDKLRLEVSDYYDAVGLQRNAQQMQALVSALHSGSFTAGEDGVIRSPSGQTAADFISHVVVFGSAATPVPSAGAHKASESSEADERAKYGGYTEADFKALPLHKQSEILETQKGPPTSLHAKQNPPVTPSEITRVTGLTAEAFAKLDPDRKIEIENEVKFNRK